MAKPRPEYEIYKRFTGRPDEPWDGPFPTLRAARARFDQAYRNPGPERRQDFAIYRITCTVMPLHRPTKR